MKSEKNRIKTDKFPGILEFSKISVYATVSTVSPTVSNIPMISLEFGTLCTLYNYVAFFEKLKPKQIRSSYK